MVPRADGVLHEHIVRVSAIDSTQRLAFELASGGAADGTVVIADQQTAGRGRRGRVWQAAAGTSLLMSLMIRPRLAAHETPRLSFVAAIAVAEAIEEATNVTPSLKWPNDVLLAGRKVAGILLESRTGGSVVVVGIGVNVRQTRFPDDLANRAVSVLQATGIDLEPDRLLTALLERFGHWRERLQCDGFGPVRERWLVLADTIGRRVKINGLTGQAVDLGDDGTLVIDDGTNRRHIVAGELESPEML